MATRFSRLARALGVTAVLLSLTACIGPQPRYYGGGGYGRSYAAYQPAYRGGGYNQGWHGGHQRGWR